MKPGVVIAALAGAALATGLVAWIGFKPVFGAFASVGPGGFVIICLYAVLLFPILGGAWFSLLPERTWRSLKAVVWARMVRESAAEVLPFSQVGGIVVGARACVLHGLSAPVAFGSTLADLTAEMMAQLAFTALGLAVFAERFKASAYGRTIAEALAAGLGLAVLAMAGFVLVQHRGLGFVNRIAEQWLPATIAHARAVEDVVQDLYRHPGKLGLSTALHLLGWAAGATGSWIILKFLGSSLSLWTVLGLESLLYAVRSAAFAVPNAWGVQEGAYALLGPLFGLRPEVALALSLLKRAREFTLGLPIILVWQAVEGRRLLAARASEASLVDR